jgi:hypothetical protein
MLAFVVAFALALRLDPFALTFVPGSCWPGAGLELDNRLPSQGSVPSWSHAGLQTKFPAELTLIVVTALVCH